MILKNSYIPCNRHYCFLMAIVQMIVCCTIDGNATGLSFVKSYQELPFANPKVWDIETNETSGWVFFCTDNGVLAFDGNLWDSYNLNNKSEVRSATFDSEEGRLYVGGINEFGYYSPSEIGTLKYTCLSDSISEQRYVGNVWGIHKTGNILYVQGDREVLVYNTIAPMQTEVVPCGVKINCSALINKTLYLGTESGVRVLKSGKVEEVVGMAELNNSRIRGIMPGMNGIVITTGNSGIFFYKNNRTQKLSLPMQIEGEVFTAVCKNNKLALGTIGKGLYLIDLADNEVNKYDESNGFGCNTVLSLAYDSNGNLWVGEDGGIEMAIVDMPLTTLSNARMSIGHGYTSLVHAGRLWLGTNRGLYSLSWPLQYPLDIKQMPGIEGQTWNLKKIGTRLMLCHDRGLFEIISPDSYKAIDGPIGVWDIKMMKGNREKVLIGTYDGLYFADIVPGGFAKISRIGGFSSCPSFAQENDSIVWVNDGSEGFTRLCVDFDNGEVLSNIKYTIADGQAITGKVLDSDGNGRVLFCTETGIYRFKQNIKRFVIDEYVAPYLKSDCKYWGVKEIGDWVYIISENEFLQANSMTGEVSLMPLFNDRVVTHHYGDLINVVDETTVILPSCKGYIFAKFAPGLNAVGKLSLNPDKINAIFSTNYGDSLLYRSNYLNISPKIELDYSQNSVKILYGDMAMSNERICEYRYRLNSEKWSAPTQSNVKEYTALGPGDYTFAVETICNDKVVSSDEISFSIRSPWWKTTVARIVYGIIIIGLIYFIVWIVRRRLKKHERELMKEQEAEFLRHKLEFQEKERQQQEQIAMLEREKMQFDYNKKSQELTNLLMSEANKNDILQEIKDELSKAMSSPVLAADQRAVIAKLYEKIKLGDHTEKVLERVEVEFNLLYNNFTQRLRQAFPSLTNAEIMLCAYIKMNLPTKEIAPLINISLRGVETMRYRVRKKLRLNRDDSLSGFIANF